MSDIQSIDTQSRIAQLRAKAVTGDLTKEEMKEGIRLMRADRQFVSRASESSKRKVAKAAIPDADELLKELGGL